MGLSLLPARPEDWPEAWALQRQAFEALVTEEHGGWTPELEQRCAREWDADRTTFLLRGGRRIGWFRLDLRPDHDLLELLVVAPDRQGQGAGSQVIRLLQARARVRGVPLWLSVHRLNRARSLYRRLDFAERERDALRVWMVWPAGAAAGPPPTRG